jgi:membrane protein implicated in regulation of membrane protease activity
MFTSIWFWLLVVVGVFIVYGIVKKIKEPKKEKPIPLSVSMPGKQGIIVVRVGESVKGRVRVDGEEWLAASTDGKAIEVGTYVTVVKLTEYDVVVKVGT